VSAAEAAAAAAAAALRLAVAMQIMYFEEPPLIPSQHTKQFDAYVTMLNDAVQTRFQEKTSAATAAAAAFVYPPGCQRFWREFDVR
jgi:hypothetical protein